MRNSNEKQIIIELAGNNFRLYPESYPLENGIATSEASENAQELGISYFENRSEYEAERDENLEITRTDYVNWCMESFQDYIDEL